MNTRASKRPNTVTIAVAMLLVVSILGTLSSYYQQTHNEALVAMAAKAPYAHAVQYVILLGSLMLSLFLQYKIFTGRNWARITALVLFVISVLMSIPSFLGMLHVTTSFKIFAGFFVLAQLVAYIVLFTGEASGWFKTNT